MKKGVITFFLAGCMGISLAQTSRMDAEKDYRNYPHWIEMMQDPQANFFETQRAFYTYWKGRKVEKGAGYKPFKRWEHFMAQQVDEKGNKPQAYQILNEIQNVQTLPVNPEMTSSSGWEEVGPVQLPSNGTGQPNGLGRINALGFHPTDPNTFYAGAPAGGLWKTTDGGSTWSSNTDQLATLGVSAIVVDHSNPNVVYFGSGDRDAGDAPGLGVYKSTDAGATWTQSNSGMGNRTVGELVMDPNNNSILIAATNGGVYRSTNGGSSWSQSISGNFKDLKLHPTNSSIVYATTGGNLYKSTNNGVSFSLSMTGIPSGKSRLVIGVTPASPNTVYILAAQGSVYGGLFKSTDSGATFSTQSTTPNIMDYSTNGSGTSGQAWYDMCIAVNPTNSSEVYVGGINIFKSTNSGSTWAINAHWVGSGGADDIHADQHILRYSPAGKLYSGNDGGVYHKGTSNETWTDISSGLAIAQCYKLGQSQTDVDRVIVGYQDNGTGIYDNGNWRTEIGGDGMESAIDYTNSAYMYGELYYGAIRRSTNNGYSFFNIAGNGVNGITESGAWVTPYVLHETDPNTMFVGYRDIWRSTNVKASSSSSVSWTEISTNLGGSGTFSVLEHNEANGNILYAAKGSALYKSENVMAASVTWSTLSVPGSGSILSIETSELDENIVYVARGTRVYKSTNKGSSWTDISSNIANSQNKTSLVYAPMSIGRGLYVSTDYGVFFKPENETDWINYSQGLPNYAKIKEIELYEDNSGNNNHKIRAASYGRGLWSNDIYLTGELVNLDITSANICLGDSATFTADNANDYFWTDPSGAVISNSAVLTVSPSQTTVYTVNGIMSNGDTTQASATVNVLNPSVSIAGQTSLCTGATATLTANVSGSGSYTYLWSNGATTQSISVSPSTSTTYSVTATSTEGCTATESHTINMVVGPADYLVVEIKTDNYPTETSWTLTGNSGHVYQTVNQGFYTSSNTVYYDTIQCVTDSCLVLVMNDSYGDGICCSFGSGYYKIFQSDGTLLTSGGAFASSTTDNFCLQPSVFELTVSDTALTACLGESVTFTASGADTYEWFNQSGTLVSSTSDLTALAQSNTTYTVYGYQNGDTLSETVSVYTNTAFVSISGNTTACENDLITLTASGSDSYVWSTGETTNSITIAYTPGNSNLAWVIGESNGCFSDTAYANLTWASNPNISVSGNMDICDGDSVTLVASGADTYQWSNGATGNSVTLTPSSTTTISVQGFTNGCGSDTIYETINVNTIPQVSISGNTTLCLGESVTLVASGADSYLWSDGSTGNTITLTPNATTTVSVQGTTSGCGSNVVTETLTVNPVPQISISGNTTICNGETLTLTATGADSYLWSNGATGSTVTLNPDSSMTISVEGTSLGCTSTSTSAFITVNSVPQVSISGNSAICSGDSITLTANGADSYVWSNGATTPSVTLSPTSTMSISVQGTSLGCTSAIASEVVIVNDVPVISVNGNTEICEGDSITLTASGAESFVWSTGETTHSITLSPSATTTVTVQGFANGCGSNIVSETIVVNPTPSIMLGGSNHVCLGDTATLSVTGADSYVWSTGETGNSISFVPTSTTTISVQGFSNGCPSSSLSQTVTVNTSTQVSISGNTEICDGESTTLTAIGAESYIWSTGETTPSITVNPSATTTISVQGFTSGCGSDMVTETITVFNNPIITVSGNSDICVGDSLTLTANGADSYEWSNGHIGSTITLVPTANTSISVQGFSNGCPSNTITEAITVNSGPTVTVSGNTTICVGETVTLTASGADAYQWSTGETGSSITLSPTSFTTVTVQGYTLGCASDVVTQDIIVNSIPQVAISGASDICLGDSVTLTASGANSYLWSNGATGNSVTIVPTATTTLSVQGTSLGCLSDVISETIVVNSIPEVTISGTSTVCAGEEVVLTASGADSYQWSNGATGNTITLSPDSSMSISVQGFTNGCSSDVVSQPITINPIPTVSISGGMDLCQGDSITLTASGADSYVWSNGETSSSITLVPSETTTISVQGSSLGCLSDMVSETIIVSDNPVISVNGNSAICVGDSIILTASGADSYTWSNGNTGSSIVLSPDSSMTVSVQGFSNGCSSNTITETIMVHPNPNIIVGGDAQVCLGDSATLFVSGADSYVWSTGETSNSITFVPVSTTTVTVQGFSNGCPSTVLTYTVNVNTSTQVSISGNTELCLGDSTTLVASGASSYLWSTGETSHSITIAPNSTSSISVQGFTNGCGSDMVSETITVHPNPVISVSGNTTICSGDSITLIASGADSYQWSNGATGNTITLNSDSSMTITVQGFTNGCGSNTISESIIVNPNPVISVSGNTTVCPGDSVTLTATGADSYVWSNGSTGNTITLTPIASGSISVQGFSNGCPSNSVNQVITVLSTPVIQISGNTEVCKGDSVILTASGADSYLWSDGSTGNSITFVPITSTTVSVQGFIAGCGSASMSETITVYSSPLVSISGNQAICDGETVTLTASGADSYMWSNGDTNTSITLSPDSSMMVSVQGFSNGCSSNIVSEMIIVHPNPIISVSGNTTVCPGDSVTLTATGASSYVWSNGSTGNSITFVPTSTTTISVQGFTNGCSSDTINTTISINSTPMVSISGDLEICEGDSTTLFASGAQTYIWSNGATGNSITIAPNTTTPISVQGFIAGCGSNMVSETIVVNPLPTISISGNQTICEGEVVTLTASGADTYLWFNGDTNASITLSPDSTMLVLVQGFSNGCSSNIISELIVVNPVPVISVSGNTTVCPGDSVTLTATGASSYVWSDGSTGNSITLVPTSATTVAVQGFTNGCSSDTVNTTISINSTPMVSISGDLEICEGDSTTLFASGAQTYIWSNGATGNSITIAPNVTTSISVQGFTSGCGSDMVSETIVVNPIPVVNITGNTQICIGDTVYLSASSGDSYLWSTGDTTQSIVLLPSSDMTISVTVGLNGCYSAANATVEVYQAPTVEITGNLEACIGETITLTASGADNYLWSTGDTSESISITVTDTTIVSVTGTSGNCASATESVSIQPNSSSSYFVVAIKTDWYGYETSWSLTDAQGNTVASHTNANGAYQNNTWYRDTVYCATIGDCYTFTINDSYGDGICCSYGNGEYSITQDDGTVLAEGGNFNYTETKNFCISEPVTEIDIEISEYDLEVCQKETFTLTASGANNYVWTTLEGTIVSQDETLTTQLNTTTTFIVTGTSGNITATDTVTVTVITNWIRIIVKTDWYGYETSWKLKDSSGNVVAERAPNTYQSNKKYKHKIKCLPDECYTLEVYDSYGDGMCCSYGYGYFKVKGPGNVTLANGGQFGYQTTEPFCFGGPAAKALPYEDMEDVITQYVAKEAPSGADLSSLDNITVYPNPSNGELFIDTDNSDFLINRYEITDVSGRILQDEVFDKPFKSKMVDISSFSSGQYMVKLYIGDQIKMVKIIKE